MSFPAISVDQWREFLDQVTPQNKTSSHKYICVTSEDGEPKKWAVLTKDEYEAYPKIPFWKIWAINPCKKLSFNEICSVTDALTIRMNTRQFRGLNYQISTKQGMASEIESFIQLGLQTTSPTVKNDVLRFVTKLRGAVTQGEIATESLIKMANRSSYNHLQEKMQGIWGTIKYYIWAWFYDKSLQIRKISQENPDIDFVKKKVIEEIRTRIFLNCANFEESDFFRAKVPPPIVHPTKEEEITSPKYVKKWLKKLDLDHYKGPFYEASRDRVAILNSLWVKLNKEFSLNP